MKPATFEYVLAESAEHAASVLADWDAEASILAGGQSLVPLMAMRLAVPGTLVDITRVPELQRITVDEAGVRIGAAVTQAAVEDDDQVAGAVPLLRAAIRNIAHREIRNAGTVCGSLAHADPSAELPAVALALDAVAEVRSADGVRDVPADELFESVFSTTLEEGELIEAIRIPRQPPGTGAAFVEVAARSGDFALVGIGATVQRSRDEVVACRLSACGVGSAPHRLAEVEHLVVGETLTEPLLEEAGRLAASLVDPADDLHGSADYRKAQVDHLVRRALRGAAEGSR